MKRFLKLLQSKIICNYLKIKIVRSEREMFYVILNTMKYISR